MSSLYLQEFNAQTAKRRLRERYFKRHTRIQRYVDFRNYTQEDIDSLAASLGIAEVKEWLRRNREERNPLQRAKKHVQTPFKQEHGTRVAGMLAFYLYRCSGNPKSIHKNFRSTFAGLS